LNFARCNHADDLSRTFIRGELFHGKAIYVRDVWPGITPNSCHFEQRFSNDGGKTWEANWIATYIRVGS